MPSDVYDVVNKLHDLLDNVRNLLCRGEDAYSALPDGDAKEGLRVMLDATWPTYSALADKRKPEKELEDAKA